MGMPISVTAYNGNPFTRTAYNRNPYIRYCVQWKSLYPVLRTMEIPISGSAYNGNPYIRTSELYLNKFGNDGIGFMSIKYYRLVS